MKGKMTLSEFKRIAQTTPLSLSLVYRYGHNAETDPSSIPQSLLGKRMILAVRSYGFDLTRNGEKGTSRLEIRGAHLFECVNGLLSVYQIGMRPVTPDEQNVINGYEKYDANFDEVSYWRKVAYYRTAHSKNYFYLIKDMTYQKDAEGRLLVRDKKVRGDLALQYRVYGLPEEYYSRSVCPNAA